MVNVKADVFGEVEIDGKTYFSDMIIWWDGRIDYREKSHTVTLKEVASLLDRKPDSLVIGTGMSGVVKVDPKVKELAEQKGIKVYVEESPKAAEIFSSFSKSGKKAIAIIHSTC
jgi:hypothetical protein